MKMKKSMLLFFILTLCVSTYTQSLSQIGFIIKKAVPTVERIAVIFSHIKVKQMQREAKPATLITKKKYLIFSCQSRSDVAEKLHEIKKMDNVVLVVIGDDDFVTPSLVQSIAQNAGESNIPVVSNREKDTLQGALLSIFTQDGKIQKHINMIIAAALKLTIPEAFLAECKIDAE
jgi:ABC-type uncharacterized transport system substrate-binding protein